MVVATELTLPGLIALAGAWRVARDLPSSVHPAAV
jgi:hypothetical protein